ncbi:MAG: hypothetical protein IPM97_09955 [Bdellovibrionaceae bacterium]|nr:hypothetical protein [Pseudobdellovibrionaceae bacterium]
MDKTALKALFGCLVLMAAYAVIKTNPSPLRHELVETTALPGDSEALVPAQARVQKVEDSATGDLADAASVDVEVPDAALSMVERIKIVQNLLPKNGQIRFKGPADAHHIHPALLRAGIELGHLKEIWLKEPAERKLAFEFYEDCTFNDRLFDSIRALCYVNAIEVSVYLEKTDQVLSWTVDNSVQSLASHLMTN